MSSMDKLFAEMRSKNLVSVGKYHLTVQQAVSYALLKRCNVDYLTRDEFDWQDWFKGNMN